MTVLALWLLIITAGINSLAGGDRAATFFLAGMGLALALARAADEIRTNRKPRKDKNR